MSVKGLIFILAVSIGFPSFSNPSDSIVRISEIKFNSDFEREYFSRLFVKKESPDYLPLFLATDKTSNTSTHKSANQRIESVIQQLDKLDINSKSEAKKIKAIYKTIHDEFLKKYELENNFNEIFQTGNYNCLSATALYSIILEKYNIPYVIKKAPKHVFLMTYPNSSKILIETTDPVKGYFQYNEQMIANYVDHMKRNKMISEEEFMTKSQAELFEKYFMKDENIGLKQLVGLQYYNLAIYEYEKEKYLEALENIQKAYLFYPSEGTKYIMKNLLLTVISKLNYDNEDEIKYYVYLTRFKSEERDNAEAEIISNEFLRITQKQLIAKSNFDHYTKSYQQIAKNVLDTTLKKEIDFIYNYEFARVVINSESDKDVEENLMKIYALKPDHLDVHGLITAYVLNQVSALANPYELIVLLDRYSNHYKFLKSNSKISLAYGACYLELAAQAYAQDQISKGDKYLQSFEEAVKVKEKTSVNEFFVNKSFSEASSAYYRKGNYSKAKNLILKGLEYAPNSYYLQVRLKSFNK